MTKLSRQIRDMRTTAQVKLKQTITDSGEQVKGELVNAIYDRYGFQDRSYIGDRLQLKVQPSQLELIIFARHRVSSAINFVQDPVYRRSVNPKTPNKLVIAGYMGAFLRGKTSHWKGAFIFQGKNNNVLLGYRDKGQTTRDIPDVPYGPSVAGSLAVIKDDVEPFVVQMLTKKFERSL
ncbi:hypothetical protein N473_26625 [Pseudoalteromonas luteoviolacea CPMOR-1]|uniref:Uncharacterized protein n=1 Tax=Pseudoalteromonas luteoviolacea CPMOR-1 TaxID=1365248 RepID=A0A167HBA7_9GAMM|nr:hypothetical protein [Pseudoalteromonas luteoviolacea]KZN57933.1 hypothetical protein N473_26625 [Pseudoalteromonas luteoviolacea CPMOR-1]